MADKYVTVATFTMPLEGQLALGRLQSEGIKAFLTGDITVHTFSGFRGLGGQVQLQVPEAEVSRSQTILAACDREGPAATEWATQAEHDASLWVCSLCGDAVSNDLTACPACQTPRSAGLNSEAVRDHVPPRHRGKGRYKAASKQLHKPKQGLPVPPRGSEKGEFESEVILPRLDTFVGDDLVRRAFRAALFGCLLPIGVFFLYSLWLVQCLFPRPAQLSRISLYKLLLTVLLDAAVLLFWVLVCTGMLNGD